MATTAAGDARHSATTIIGTGGQSTAEAHSEKQLRRRIENAPRHEADSAGGTRRDRKRNPRRQRRRKRETHPCQRRRFQSRVEGTRKGGSRGRRRCGGSGRRRGRRCLPSEYSGAVSSQMCHFDLKLQLYSDDAPVWLPPRECLIAIFILHCPSLFHDVCISSGGALSCDVWIC
jgi:hypothetical protein